ncbi:MAG: hypothetical protein Q8L66_02110 [Caulobacter sp.]|nr:hypothetical protein [Caulobacter sp.]
MAELPTAEDAARRILAVFRKVQARENHVLRLNNFLDFPTEGFTGSDFEPGIEYAVESGWLEISSSSSFRLTAAGFSEL